MKSAKLTVRKVQVVTNGATVGHKWAKLVVDGKVVAQGQIRYIRGKAKKLGFIMSET